ncbi:outer membrane protein transport protein [Geomonas subterranea]|uniref:Outer membrane protein transport protein n=1 Tax=Geomonas subterranea TaxID=2847989 RepID=A0ABX8LFA0_9BACT|nr:OmpP1/FadL family transporter [Geomonas subterranea]QXE90725.1 outer membrane protein transport protein [Geomonas subterranea]QXM11193.1 outer membrane protein transport protein [Geomonas subterranea]
MRKWLVSVLLLCALPGLSGVCHGAGFKVSEQGAKAMGMGNAFAAQADDASALYFNPAGIAFLPGIQVSLGALGILVPQTDFHGTTPLSGTPPLDTGTAVVTEHSRRDIVIAPTLYASYALENLPLSFGLGVNATYPLSKSWDDSSVFRNQVQIASIKPINFQPTVAYRVDALNLGVAAGIDITYAMVSLQKSLYSPVIDPTAPAPPFGAYEVGSLGLNGTAIYMGYNLGLLWKPRRDLSFGLAYRSKITLDITGDANFLATTPTGMGAIGLSDSALFPYTRAHASSSASTSITLPDTLDLAIAWRPTDRITLEFDATRTGWSSFEKLEFHFDSPQFAAFNNQPDPRKWRDVWSYKFGAQYVVNPRLALRAGYSFDESPVPDQTVDPLLPDADRHSFSVGTGIGTTLGSVDLAYMWVHFVDRAVHNQEMTTLRGSNGVFKSDAYLLAANLNLKF